MVVRHHEIVGIDLSGQIRDGGLVAAGGPGGEPVGDAVQRGVPGLPGQPADQRAQLLGEIVLAVLSLQHRGDGPALLGAAVDQAPVAHAGDIAILFRRLIPQPAQDHREQAHLGSSFFVKRILTGFEVQRLSLSFPGLCHKPDLLGGGDDDVGGGVYAVVPAVVGPEDVGAVDVLQTQGDLVQRPVARVPVFLLQLQQQGVLVCQAAGGYHRAHAVGLVLGVQVRQTQELTGPGAHLPAVAEGQAAARVGLAGGDDLVFHRGRGVAGGPLVKIVILGLHHPQVELDAFEALAVLVHLFDVGGGDLLQVVLQAHIGVEAAPLQIEEVQGVVGVVVVDPAGFRFIFPEPLDRAVDGDLHFLSAVQLVFVGRFGQIGGLSAVDLHRAAVCVLQRRPDVLVQESGGALQIIDVLIHHHLAGGKVDVQGGRVVVAAYVAHQHAVQEHPHVIVSPEVVGDVLVLVGLAVLGLDELGGHMDPEEVVQSFVCAVINADIALSRIRGLVKGEKPDTIPHIVDGEGLAVLVELGGGLGAVETEVPLLVYLEQAHDVGVGLSARYMLVGVEEVIQRIVFRCISHSCGAISI